MINIKKTIASITTAIIFFYTHQALAQSNATLPKQHSVQTAQKYSTSTKDTPRLVVQTGHGDQVWSVASSPDGAYLLSGDGSGTVIMWETTSGKIIRSIKAHVKLVSQVAFLGTLQYAVTASDNQIRIWDLVTGKMYLELAEESSSVLQDVTSLAVSGECFAVCRSDGSVGIYDFNGTMLRKDNFSPGHTAATFTGSNSQIAILDSSGTVWLVPTSSTTDKPTQLTILKDLSFHSPLASSPDGAFLAAGGKGSIQIIPIQSPDTLKVYPISLMDNKYPEDVNLVAFSRNGTEILFGAGITLAILSPDTGKRLSTMVNGWHDPLAVATLPEGRFATAGRDGRLFLWNSEGGTELKLGGLALPITGLASIKTAHDDFRLLTGSGRVQLDPAEPSGSVRIWNLQTGAAERQLSSLTGAAAGMTTLHENQGAMVQLARRLPPAFPWDTLGRYEYRIVSVNPSGDNISDVPSDGYENLTCSKGGSSCLAAISVIGKGISADIEIRLIDQKNGTVKKVLGKAPGIGELRLGISEDGRRGFAGNSYNGLWVWSLPDGNLIAHEPYFIPLGFTPDEKNIIVTENTSTILGDSPATISQYNPYMKSLGQRTAIPAGRPHLLMQLTDNLALVALGTRIVSFNISNGEQKIWEAGHDARISSLMIAGLPAGIIASASDDGSTMLWDVARGTWLVKLISFSDGNWAVLDPDGRFDAGNLEEIKGLHWILPGSPFKPVPIETLMQDYYEPGLLARIIKGEKIARTVPDLSGLNILRPSVGISSITPDAGDPTLVRIKLKIEESVSADGKQSGAQGLRLFRNGRLVQVWNTVDLSRGTSVISNPIRLPRTGNNSYAFSAYAFNDSWVKSDTQPPVIHKPAIPLSPRSGAIFLISIGVNSHQNDSWNLDFAASDARLMLSALGSRLEKLAKAVDRYNEYIPVSLISNQKEQLDQATGANLRTVLDILAGRKVPEAADPIFGRGHRVRRAEPEDLIIFTFSGHGWLDQQSGTFYLITSDTGPGKDKKITKELRDNAISSSYLGHCLRDMDAGEMIFILDACQSGGVKEKEFKPGPFGSKGLAQLAYDKGIRILAGSQADNMANEAGELQQSLLTFAFAREGILEHMAGPSTPLTLNRALAYPLTAVPRLYDELLLWYERGKIPKWLDMKSMTYKTTLAGKGDVIKARQQVPVLFDFIKNRLDDTILEK